MMRRFFRCVSPLLGALLVGVLLQRGPIGGPLAAATGELPVVAPEEAGLDGRTLARIEPLVDQAIAAGRMPGCVIAIGRRNHLAWLKAFGHRRIQPTVDPMTVDTLFDMASITKPVATATSVMILVEQGRLCLSDPVSLHLPEFAGAGKERITIEQLLVHQ